VQEASSMFLHEVLRQAGVLGRKCRVLDLAAAPGGKSTLIASALSGTGMLVANETIRKRIGPLRHNLTKWGYANVMVTNHDPMDFSPALRGFFDVVCVDAPCSGEGLFRKAPRAAGEWSVARVAHCSARQKRILREAVQLLAPGGCLIYSTCTYNNRENDGNMEWMPGQGRLEPVSLTVPKEWGIVKTGFGYQFYPHRLKGEGFYIAVLKKNEGTERKRGRGRLPDGLSRLTKKEREQLRPWIARPEDFSFYKKPDNALVAVPREWESDFLEVARPLRRRSFGLPVGTFKGGQLVPAHELALSLHVNSGVPAIELDLEQALLFLKKQPFAPGGAQKGWHLVRYRGFSLGWAKLLGHRFNNYLPNEWRIRMA
ncbi:MAG TPA: RNA methyltransferase, partial [Phaeodactylibacter sp.]|nr:RNA methyltransferase [Phaeodactylibacter sp.]